MFQIPSLISPSHLSPCTFLYISGENTGNTKYCISFCNKEYLNVITKSTKHLTIFIERERSIKYVRIGSIDGNLGKVRGGSS
jgi:hypothetical protein